VSAGRAVLVLAFSSLVVARVLAADLDGAAPGAGLVPPGLAVRPELRLVWFDPADVGDGAGPGARDEAKKLLSAMGLDVRWRPGRSDEVAQEDEIRVILLDRAAVNAQGAPVLGSTPRKPGELPYLWVHVPSVRASLGATEHDGSLSEFAGRRRVAIAIGRVIAHEVVHVLAPAIPHGRGLMASRLTSRDLTSGATPVDPEVALAVRTALTGGPVPPPADADGLVAVEHAGKEVRR